MQKILIACILLICCLMQACQTGKNKPTREQDTAMQTPSSSNTIAAQSPRISKVYDSSKVENFYPFILYKDGTYMVAAEIESEPLFTQYNPIFEKYKYSGNGYSWEGHIKQILKKENPGLLSHIQFDPEAGGFYIFADSETTQREFAKLMSSIFSNIPKLEEYLKTADRSKIDD